MSYWGAGEAIAKPTLSRRLAAFFVEGVMKQLGIGSLVFVGFVSGVFFVYSCGGGGSAVGGGASWPAPVAATGQTTSYAGSDDGALQAGIAWLSPRYTDNGDATVTDELTGLIWLQNANCFGTTTWDNALIASDNLADGQCGLIDGSIAGDWRLPNARELTSLVDYGQYNPSIASGTPFTGVQSAIYFTSTTFAFNANIFWGVQFINGYTYIETKSINYYVWPVRGGA